MGRQPVLAAYGWWFPTLTKSISANELIRGRRPFDSESLVAIGKLWLALRYQIIQTAGEPTLPSLLVLKRTRPPAILRVLASARLSSRFMLQ